MTKIYDALAVETPITLSMDEVLNHGICVSNLAYAVAKELGLSGEECHKIAVAGLLHDIGKIKLNTYVYQRENTLAIDQMRYMRLHSSLGYAILKDRGYDEEILEAVLYHHENYDGSGYPKNLKGDVIPVGARILRVCDAFGALISNRPYREAFDKETALDIMVEEVKYFDMRVYLAFQRVSHSEELNRILDIFGISE
ncbi:MAG: HD domain-containing protein [Lachnospiraceae bacterium]|nr:HD domain-containing protein [Lachnospiraceae bacterium]